MGKRAKKKVQAPSPARIGSGARAPSFSASPSTSSPSESGRSAENSAPVNTECPHVANVEKLRSQLAKSTVIYCLECAKLRSGVSASKERKGKVKGVRKKQNHASQSLGMPDEKSNTHKLWICLSCGHVGCGAVNSSCFVTSNGGGDGSKQVMKQGVVGRGHAWQHWLQLKHPMAMLCGDEFSSWCFLCEVARDRNFVPEAEHTSPVENEALEIEVDREADVEPEPSALPSRVLLLQQSAKLIRDKLTEQFEDVRDDTEETKFLEESGRPASPLESENGVEEEPEPRRNNRVMKGLVNLGNTCFFNSVMQNLLSVELLRNHFGLESTVHEGALTSSLRKFFQEASAHSQPEANGSVGNEAGGKKSSKARGGGPDFEGAYNPKGLFGAICSKAPRFKGFQQQDSHELLRCLLDGLHTEEESARKASSKSKTAGGEDALRALSKPDACENGGKTRNNNCAENSPTLLQDTTQEGSGEGIKVEDDSEIKTPARIETFVEQVFGGQLSSTVSCCECGHCSVVYESFLDLSLPIPSKRPSKKMSTLQNGNEKGPSLALSKRAQPVKISKSNTVGDLNVFKSTPAGLGTPLLLLPPPPLKDQGGDYINAGTESDSGWLDYVNPGMGSDNTDWLDLLDEGIDGDSKEIFGCSRSREAQPGLDCIPTCESQIIFGCAPNLALIQQSEGISASDGNGDCQTRLDPPADASQLYVELKKNGDFEAAAISLGENGHAANPSLQIVMCNNFLRLEAASEASSRSKNCSRLCEAEKSVCRPMRGQDTDVQVLMRGGSDSQSFGLTQDAGLDYYPVTERLIDTSASVEQSWDCNDGTRLHSDIINGPSGTVILLGPPVENGMSMTCSNLLLETDYDGVGSLFEEEDNNEDITYGPFPLIQDGAGFESSSTYNEIGFDDVLDLSKISSEGRGDWLVPNDDKQVEAHEHIAMSLEGCLQIFTRTELLSGENAWECEICTKKYHEKPATLSIKPLATSPRKHQLKRSISKSRIEFSESSGKKSTEADDQYPWNEDRALLELAGNEGTEDARTGDFVSCDGCQDGELNVDDVLSRKVSRSVNLEVTGSCNSPAAAETVPSASFDMVANGKMPSLSGAILVLSDVIKNGVHENGRKYEACSEGHCASTQTAHNASLKVFLETGDLTVVISNDLGGEMRPSEEIRKSADTRVEAFCRAVEGNEVDNQNPDTEASALELENKVSVVNSRSSGKTLKLKKSKSRKVSGELKKVIKQDATKKLLISRAPPVLTIQLKRFAQDMRGRLSKLSGHVAFNEWLDLYPFLDHRQVNFDCKYRLIGTVEHSGTLKSGHYVAFVRGPTTVGGGESSWYYISDACVRQTTLEAVLQSEAYLVFYERVDMSSDSLHS